MADELDEQLIQTMMLRDPGAAAKGRFAPLMQDYMRLQNESARRALAPTDTTELQKAGYARALQGQEQQMAGMALATAVPQFRNIAQSTYESGQKAVQPSEMGEGIFTPGQGYTADPFKAKDRLTRTMAAQAGAAAHAASAYGQQEDREANRLNQAEQLKLQRATLGLAQAKHAADIAAGKIQKITDSFGNETLVRITPTGYEPLTGTGGAAAGANRPDILPKHATSEDKNLYSRGSLALEGGANILTQLQDPKMRSEFNVSRGVRSQIEAATGLPVGAGSPEQKQLRATINARAYTIIHDLAGATLSPQEKAKIQTFAPGPNDSVEMIESKIRSAMEIAGASRRVLRRNYGMPEDAEQYGGVMAKPGGVQQAQAPRAGDKWL